MNDEQLFIDSLHIFGRVLFLAVVAGLAFQGGTKITVPTIQVGEMTRLGKSSSFVLGVLQFQC